MSTNRLQHLLAPLLAVAAALAISTGASAQTTSTLDDFSSIDAWSATGSDGVDVSLTSEHGELRVDVDFRSGAGFCVVNRPIGLDLPANFAIAFDVRAENLPPNDLELKLLTPETRQGTDVWWHNRRAFEFPTDTTTLTSKRRHFEFAWGPSGGSSPLVRLEAIEFAIASVEGGRGTLVIDNLRLITLPTIEPYAATPTILASSDRAGWPTLEEDRIAGWRPDAQRESQLTVEFNQPREITGLTLEWNDDETPPPPATVTTSFEGTPHPDAVTLSSPAPIQHAFFGDRLATSLTIAVPPTRLTLASLRIVGLDEAPDTNALIAAFAAHAQRGRFPQPFLGRQTHWTVLGVPHDDNEALINEHGAIEIAKGGPTIEPVILDDGALITWADAATSQTLLDTTLPIPSVRWNTTDLTLDVQALAQGEPGASSVLARYTITNTSSRRINGRFALCLRPFQILPPWQRLNLTGGVSPIRALAIRSGRFLIDDRPGPVARTPGFEAGVTPFTGADVVAQLASGALPTQDTAYDPLALASGAIVWPLALSAGESASFVLEIPLHAGADSSAQARDFESALARASALWRERLGRTRLLLPPSARRIADTIDANLAYILINQDGPAIQPGSRTYERSWIRDGCMTSAALLALGHADVVRDFIDWYAPNQFPSGKVPCVVDRRGPDPVDEHDSTGQLIMLIRTYVDVTGDTAFARKYLPSVVAGVEYLESLRAQRLGPEYDDPDSPRHAFRGLLPESISHEGYSAKPMHSYWDDMFALRGFYDAAAIARVAGEPALASRFVTLAERFRRDLNDSIALAMETHGIDYIPGCVELGDFDATSTAIAIHPGNLLHKIATPAAFDATFDRYWEHFVARRNDSKEWNDYTPYEARIIAALLRLGRPDQAHALLDWLMLDQLPPAWLHWAEVGYRDDHFPGWIGDMPHTWVGAGFINSAIALFAYSRASDDALVIAAGVKPEWLEETPDGVGVENLHTRHGVLSYRLSQSANTMTLSLAPGVRVPAGGIAFAVPGETPIDGATIDAEPTLVTPDRIIRIRHAPATVVVTLAR